MSEMTKNGTSDDTLIRDSQLTGFHLFKERIGSCCCRLFKKSSNYNLSSVSKDIQQQEDKPSYINQAFQKDKKQRKDKLDQIAKSLPTTINQSSSSNRIVKTQLTPSSNLFQPKTPLSTINNRKIQEEISTDDSSEEEEEEEEENSSDSSDSSKKAPVKSANKKR